MLATTTAMAVAGVYFDDVCVLGSIGLAVCARVSVKRRTSLIKWCGTLGLNGRQNPHQGPIIGLKYAKGKLKLLTRPR
jgi:hypothetical protein